MAQKPTEIEARYSRHFKKLLTTLGWNYSNFQREWSAAWPERPLQGSAVKNAVSQGRVHGTWVLWLEELIAMQMKKGNPSAFSASKPIPKQTIILTDGEGNPRKIAMTLEEVSAEPDKTGS